MLLHFLTMPTLSAWEETFESSKTLRAGVHRNFLPMAARGGGMGILYVAQLPSWSVSASGSTKSHEHQPPAQKRNKTVEISIPKRPTPWNCWGVCHIQRLCINSLSWMKDKVSGEESEGPSKVSILMKEASCNHLILTLILRLGN